MWVEKNNDHMRAIYKIQFCSSFKNTFFTEHLQETSFVVKIRIFRTVDL